MNISDLLSKPAPEAPRRSLSNPHSISAPSPATSAAKLPTPPHSMHKAMPHKRGRHDPKPIWAVRENDALEPHHQDHRSQRQQSRGLSTTPHLRPQALPASQHNGHPPAPPQPPPNARTPNFGHRELIGFERPITDDAEVYDETARQICDLIWNSVITSQPVRHVLAEDPHTQLEIEARWGQILDRQSNMRLKGMHQTECIVHAEGTKFESTMSLEQHKKMNQFLNGEVTKSLKPDNMRAEIKYKHIHEVDTFYDLDRAGFALLHPILQEMIHKSGTTQRIRVTRNQKTGEVIRKIIKLRIVNLEISSPQTEWDYRIGINLEINFPGPLESLQPATEKGRPVDERRKDRMSYSFLNAYSVDLTQVVQANSRNHELELELSPELVMEAAEAIRRNESSDYESLVRGLINNLRVLSREMTKPAQLVQ